MEEVGRGEKGGNGEEENRRERGEIRLDRGLRCQSGSVRRRWRFVRSHSSCSRRGQSAKCVSLSIYISPTSSRFCVLSTTMGEGNTTQTVGPGVESYITAAPTKTAYVESLSPAPTSVYLANKGLGTIGPDGVREGHQLALGLGLGLGGLALIVAVVRHFSRAR